MGKSYKRTPIVKDNSKGMKKFANKKVRRQKEIPNGRAYKKIFCSYDISDYSFFQTEKDVIKEWESNNKQIEQGVKTWKLKLYKTLEEELNHWKKYYKNK